MDFSGKVTLVAGGTGGLGRAVTLAFLNAGATVAVPYRSAVEWEALRSAAGAAAARLSGSATDITEAAATRAFVESVVQAHARIDILVNAAGGYVGGKNVWESDDETYQRMLNLNLRTGFVLARAVLPVMLRQGSGRVVSVASRAGVAPAAGAALYSASKAAAVSLFGSLADEVKGKNINVNTVLPSIIDTPANRRAMPGADFSKWPKPEEIARVILFLCSDDARLIHGAVVPVYGGS